MSKVLIVYFQADGVIKKCFTKIVSEKVSEEFFSIRAESSEKN